MTLNNDKLVDYIHVENIIPPEVCQNILNRLETLEWTKHEWYSSLNDKFVSNTEQKAKEFDVVHRDYEIHSTLVPHIKQICISYENKYKFNYGKSTSGLIKKFSIVRYNRYQVGQKIVPHYDHIHSIFDGNEKGIPVISLIGVFNDDYEGGELKFWRDHKINLKQGDIVAFPSVFMYPHEVTEVTKGTRYSWVSWCY